MTSEYSTQSRASLPGWSIRRPLSTLMLTLSVIVLGLLFSGRMPIDLLPQVEYPHIRVVVNYAGVPPEIIEEQVTRPLERNLSATENLREIHGRASEGRSYIEMYFDVGTDIDLALQDAARQLERARTELPAGIDPPRLMKMDPALDPVFEIAITSPVRDAIELREWVDQRLLPQLLSVNGVGSVDLAGGKEREIDVELDPERMHAFGYSITDVGSVITARNTDQPIGNVTGVDYDIMGRVLTRYRSAHEVSQTLLPVRDGSIRLSEIARVRDHYREQRLFAFLNDQSAVQVSIMKQPRANTIDVTEGLRSRLTELRDSGFIPMDIESVIIQDKSFFIQASVRSVASAALIGGLLASGIIYIFLGSFRRALIVASVIPVALLATTVLMNWNGMTLNIFTLGAMALGVGLLIDNAIVVIENITRTQLENEDNAESAQQGSNQVLSAIVAGSATNLAAILPFLLLSGLAAMLFREFILTIVFAITASLIASLTIIPALTARTRTSKKKQRLQYSSLFESVLKRTLKFPRLTVFIALALTVGSVVSLSKMTPEFFPPVDDGRITMRFTLPSGTSLEPTNEAASIIRDTVSSMPYVEHQYQTVGGYFRGGQLSIRGGMIDMTVQLVPRDERPDVSATQWITEFRAALSEANLPLVQQRIRGPRIDGLRTSLVDTDIAIGITGDDLARLEQYAHQIVEHIQQVSGISDVQVGRDEKVMQLLIDVDDERAQQFGLSSQQIGDYLRQGIEGYVPGQFVEGGFEYNIRLRYPRSITGQIATLQHLHMASPSGIQIPLSELLRFEERPGPAHIERVNQIRVVWVNVTADQSQVSIGELGGNIRNAVRELTFGDGFGVIYAGEESAIAESTRSMQIAILLAVFFVFVVLVVQYERLFSAFVILSAMPMGAIGVSVVLWLTGMSLSLPVFLGIVFLVGILVNNSILLVEFAEQQRRTHKINLEDAIFNAARVRLRPVLMTTLTTLAGMLPLALGIGIGTEIMQPLAVSVIGGLTIGTLFTLCVVPALYLTFGRLTRQ